MNLIKRSAWRSVLKVIEKNISKDQFQTWFFKINVVTFTKNSIKIIVPNLFVKECLSNNYTELISNSIFEVCKINPKISFVCENKKNLKSATSLNKKKDSYFIDSTSNINKNYTFENFIVGQCNNLAHAAAKSVIESPGYIYNPLYIYGPTGIGKTHLLQSIYITLCKNNYSGKVLYLTCEDLINKLVTTLGSGELENFRKKCREVDILLIDDIHFLSKSEMLKEEFFHTFNSLYNSQKQIVITSNCLPEKITKIEERLISRFNWGLKCRLDTPDIETSIAIIDKKTSHMGIKLPLDVKQLIAENITSNVREVEGAILKLKENSLITKRKINLDLAKNTLSEYVNENNDNYISVEKILKVTSTQFNLNISKLLSKNRTKSITLPRQIAMYLTRKLTLLSFNEIGCYFGGRDHTTVMYAYEKIKKSNNENNDTKSLLINLENKLQRF